MYSRFESVWTERLDGPPSAVGEVWSDRRLERVDGFDEFAAKFSGATFAGGAYRVHDTYSAAKAAEYIQSAFPDFGGRVLPFSYDWLGRQFALDFARMQSGQPLVTMFEAGTGEALEIPAGLVEFHNVELIDYADAALALDFYVTWRASSGGPSLGRDECVGYKTPLFLGGVDATDNLEVTNMEVYWGVIGQICAQLRGAGPHPSIRGVSIEGL